jgi:ABC-type transport system involved in multi-copper enzyme maturation permease subunit
MGRILALGLNTFREAVRNRILYSLLFFAVALILSALVLGQLSVNEEARVTRDLGLGGISLFGVLIAIFVGVNLVYKELDKKTVFSLVSKPIRRFELILGKFVGMKLTLVVQIAIMGVFLGVVLLVQGEDLEPALLRALTLTLLEVLVITSIAILFSSFSSPFLSGAFTLGLFVIGRSLPELREVIAKLEIGPAKDIINAILHVVPDLRLFYVSGAMIDGRYISIHGDFVSWGYVLSAALYATGYIGCALALASLFFSRRDFV